MAIAVSYLIRAGDGPAPLEVLGSGPLLAQAEFVPGLVPWDKRFIAIAADDGVKLSSVFQILHAFGQAGKLTRKALIAPVKSCCKRWIR
jgi:hypothetical protein